MSHGSSTAIWVVIACLLLCSATAHAFTIWAKDIPGLSNECVHEQITAAAVACAGATCKMANACTPVQCIGKNACTAVSYSPFRTGVRWNDDPMAYLDYGRNYLVWDKCYQAGKRWMSEDPKHIQTRCTLEARSHFGDLQYIHSMAAEAGQLPADVQMKQLLWARFLYLIITASISADDKLRDLSKDDVPVELRELDSPVIHLFVPHCLRVMDDNPRDTSCSRKRLFKVAAGALLHTVQDAYSLSHVERSMTRAPGSRRVCITFGPIKQYYVYTLQDTARHAREDKKARLDEFGSRYVLQQSDFRVSTCIVNAPASGARTC